MIYAFDIESYPNFFCVTFKPIYEGEEHTQVFELSERRDDKKELLSFLQGREISGLAGFNNISYDTPMLRYFIKKARYTTRTIIQALNDFSDRLINSDQDNEVMEMRYRDVPWRQIDLMKIEALHRSGVGLKQAGININWPLVQDFPFNPLVYLTTDKMDTILAYNLNDVDITIALYKKLKSEIDLRVEVSKMYKVDAMSASRSKMANLILEKIYVEKTGRDIRSLRELRTNRYTISLTDCIAPNISFQTPQLQALLETFKSTKVSHDNGFKYKQSVVFDGVKYDLGVGGIHSDDKPGIFRASETEALCDVDVASYYPSIMLQNKIKPAHLGDEFIRILGDITKQRIEAKHKGEKTKADALKITINSIFGKLNSNTFWLYDPLAFLSVTVSGQLYLMMLIERLTQNGFKIVSANTDGILCKYPVAEDWAFEDICKQWMKDTDFELEFTHYSLYVRSDVNNYLAVKSTGKTKEKGRFSETIQLNGGYRATVIATALRKYFIDSIPIKETIYTEGNPYAFCLSQKVGSQFRMEHRFPFHTTDLQKNNRFYVSTTGGMLQKRNIKTNKRLALYLGWRISLANDLRNVPFPDDINYDYYIKETDKIIDEITPKFIQLGLF